MINDNRIYREGESLSYKITQKIRKFVNKKKRLKLDEELKRKILSRNFTLITQNCVGGVIYHALGMPFLSPTINLCFDGPDFVKFACNLKYYLSLDMVEVITDKKPYPVGRLNDVDIYFVHYKTFEEAKKKWNERRERVNYDKIIVIGTDRDGMQLDNWIAAFDNIPFKKIMYTASPIKEYNWVRFCKCWKRREQVGIITAFPDLSGERYYEKYADLHKIIDS